jgi:hypothetical protein
MICNSNEKVSGFYPRVGGGRGTKFTYDIHFFHLRLLAESSKSIHGGRIIFLALVIEALISSVKFNFKAHWLLNVTSNLTLKKSAFWPDSVFMNFMSHRMKRNYFPKW